MSGGDTRQEGGKAVIALSPQSPLGQKLLGLYVGDVAEIINSKYVIEGIE